MPPAGKHGKAFTSSHADERCPQGLSPFGLRTWARKVQMSRFCGPTRGHAVRPRTTAGWGCQPQTSRMPPVPTRAGPIGSSRWKRRNSMDSEGAHPVTVCRGSALSAPPCESGFPTHAHADISPPSPLARSFLGGARRGQVTTLPNSCDGPCRNAAAVPSPAAAGSGAAGSRLATRMSLVVLVEGWLSLRGRSAWR